MAKREIVTHSSEETIERGREYSGRLKATDAGVAFGRPRGGEDDADEGDRERAGRGARGRSDEPDIHAGA